MCEEYPFGLIAFLSTRPPKGLKKLPNQRSDHLVIPNKTDGELHEIMIKSRGHFSHMGRGSLQLSYFISPGNHFSYRQYVKPFIKVNLTKSNNKNCLLFSKNAGKRHRGVKVKHEIYFEQP